MQNFSNLLGKTLLSDDNLETFSKRIDENLKTTQSSNDFFVMVYKLFQAHSFQLEKALQENFPEAQISPSYYLEFSEVFKQMSQQIKIFSQSITVIFHEMISAVDNCILGRTNKVFIFKKLINEYHSQQQILLEMGKKYFKSLKNIQQSMETYKISLVDVNLVYNQQQKLKRYNICLNFYQAITQEYLQIKLKIQKLNSLKDQIKKCYESIIEEETKIKKETTNCKISATKKFIDSYCLMHKKLLVIIVDKKLTLEKNNLQCVFKSLPSFIKQEYFNCQIKPLYHKQCPPLLFYHSNVKQQYKSQYCRGLIDFIKQIQQRVNNRKISNQKIIGLQDYITKTVSKQLLPSLKECLAFSEKKHKIIVDCFGKKFTNFIKSINSILQLSLVINKKLVQTNVKSQMNTQAYISQDNKLLDQMVKNMNLNIQKFLGKKQLKKLKKHQLNEEQAKYTDISLNQISNHAQYLINLIEMYDEKMNINYLNIKKELNQVINQIFLSNNQLYSLALEYQSKYFGHQQYPVNFKKYEIQLDAILVKDVEKYQEINIGGILKDIQKATFEGEVEKFQQFKNLKKPSDRISLQLGSQKNPIAKSLSESIVTQHQKSESNLHIQKGLSMYKAQSQKWTKYMDILTSKIRFTDGEQLIKSYICGLSDKIILQGRLFITTQRLCFYSKFNRNNLFFGDTFIDVPKFHIKKIQKKKNAIFFDNSLMITTVNGQLFLASFNKRDQAYNLICKTFQIHQNVQHEQNIVEVEENINHQNEILQQTDDITNQQVEARLKQIPPLVIPFQPFKQILVQQVQFPGITPFFIFKLFYTWQQIVVNGKKHKSFIHYFRQKDDHKNIQISNWNPILGEFLNTSNIKTKTPFEFKLNIEEIIPLKSSGIPFMPKTCLSCQQQTVWIFSRDKIIVQSRFRTKAPYGDTFEVYLRTHLLSIGLNKCEFRFEVYTNFFSKPFVWKIIDNAARDDSAAGMKNFVEQIRKYLKNVKKAKKQKANEKNNEVQAKQNQIEKTQQKIQKLQQENIKIIQQLKIKDRNIKKKDKILVASFILNIILIIIIFT